MIYEVSPYFVYGFFILAMVAVVAFMYMFQGWRLRRKVWDKETKSKKVVAGVFEVDGFPHKYLVPIEKDGATIKVKGRTYFLPKLKESSSAEIAIASAVVGAKELGVEADEVKPPPPFAFIQYPEGGFGPKVVLRYVEYDEGNPEPRRGFYGVWVRKEENKWIRCDPGDEGAKFIQNQLVVTQSELDSYKDQIQAIAIAERLKEMDAMLQTFQKALANIPSKALLYILLFLAIVAPFIAGALGY